MRSKFTRTPLKRISLFTRPSPQNDQRHPSNSISSTDPQRGLLGSQEHTPPAVPGKTLQLLGSPSVQLLPRSQSSPGFNRPFPQSSGFCSGGLLPAADRNEGAGGVAPANLDGAGGVPPTDTDGAGGVAPKNIVGAGGVAPMDAEGAGGVAPTATGGAAPTTGGAGATFGGGGFATRIITGGAAFGDAGVGPTTIIDGAGTGPPITGGAAFGAGTGPPTLGGGLPMLTLKH